MTITHSSRTQQFVDVRVFRIVQETADTKTYCFQPAAELVPAQSWAHLPAFKAGSHIQVSLDIAGTQIERTYSLSSSPWDNHWAITVKKVTGGKASNWMFEQLSEGDTLKISAPSGDFVLPEQPDGQLLFLSAGSGITPVMSMLRYLLQSGNRSQIQFLHFARSHKDIIFEDELRALQETYPQVSIKVVVESANHSEKMNPLIATEGRISAELLLDLVQSLPSLTVYLCGPAPFMKLAHEQLTACGTAAYRIHSERFSTAGLIDDSEEEIEIQFTESQTTLKTLANKTLLTQAEQAGLHPPSACRVGICKSCQCKKTSGQVTNILTGELLDESATHVLPCISVAKTDVSISM